MAKTQPELDILTFSSVAVLVMHMLIHDYGVCVCGLYHPLD